MDIAEDRKRFGHHKNAFGFLRLLFASLVIVSHVPEVVDNNSHRELLTRLFGTITFGGLAVYGFFLISGYLISKSYISSPSIGQYIKKRIVRIYPAFVAASILCLIFVTPLSGAPWPKNILLWAATSVANIAILARPMVSGAFPGQHYNDVGAALDGAMWTIQYEFLSYLAVIVLGAVGAFRRPWLVAILAIMLILGSPHMPGRLTGIVNSSHLFPGPLSALPNLLGVFLAGAAFQLWEHQFKTAWIGAAIAIAGLTASLFSTLTATLGVAVFGGYLIFSAAKAGGRTVLSSINNENDVSYGVYLYGWPIEQVLIRYIGTGSLLILGLGTWAIALVCGYLSWAFLEKPAMEWLRARKPRRTEEKQSIAP